MKKYVNYLTSILCIFAVECSAIFVVDISQSNDPISYDDTGTKITASRSVRVVTFDTDEQKIVRLEYLAVTTKNVEFKATLNTCKITYTLTKDNKIDFAIKPTPPKDKYWYRSNGNFIGWTGLHDLEELDTTLPGWKYLVVKECRAINNIDDLSSILNKHTKYSDAHKKRVKQIENLTQKLEQTKKKKEKEEIQENIEKLEKIKGKRSSASGKRLKAKLHYFKKNIQKEVTIDNFFVPEYKKQMGELGELACDLTMMLTQNFVKIDGKCGANNGFDGLYQYKDIIIASESKFHQNPPTLDEIFASHLKPKFSIDDKRAITLIKEDVREKIINARNKKTLYLLAYALMKDGSVDCHLNTQPYSFPIPVKIKEEKNDISCAIPHSLTPDSSAKDKKRALLSMLRAFQKATKMDDESMLDVISTQYKA